MAGGPLRGQVAVITGASSGIGAAVARELSGAGMRLVLNGRRRERLRSLAEQLPETVYLCGDLREPALPGQLLSLALERFGSCDVVFNNAGILVTGRVEEIDLEALSEMIRINVEAAFRVAYTAVRHFLRQGHGHLISTSSVLGNRVRPGAGAYAGTKHALEALSEALRLELAGTGVQVSCVQPGLVLTELHRGAATPPVQSLGIQKPLQPEDVARCVRFMLEQPSRLRVARLLLLPEDSPL